MVNVSMYMQHMQGKIASEEWVTSLNYGLYGMAIRPYWTVHDSRHVFRFGLSKVSLVVMLAQLLLCTSQCFVDIFHVQFVLLGLWHKLIPRKNDSLGLPYYRAI